MNELYVLSVLHWPHDENQRRIIRIFPTREIAEKRLHELCDDYPMNSYRVTRWRFESGTNEFEPQTIILDFEGSPIVLSFSGSRS